uniref:Uncharacterized protein n=1 Tax=Bombyx mori TaxID=7091 RepID=A0A8R2R5V0_BOMMO
ELPAQHARLLLGYSRLGVWWWGAECAVRARGAWPRACPRPPRARPRQHGPAPRPVLLQAMGVRAAAGLRHLMFPPEDDPLTENQVFWAQHAGLRRLARRLRLQRSAGYVTLADIGVPDLGCASPPAAVQLGECRRR